MCKKGQRHLPFWYLKKRLNDELTRFVYLLIEVCGAPANGLPQATGHLQVISLTRELAFRWFDHHYVPDVELASQSGPRV